MKNILSKICFILFVIGVTMADSENLLIPVVITIGSGLGTLYFTKEEK